MGLGRPSEYDPKYDEIAFNLLCEGASIAEVGWHLRKSQQCLSEWREKYPTFGEAIKKGVEIAQGWWEKEGRTSLRDDDFNPTLWYMNMKNRFGWKDKQETAHTITVNHESLLKELEDNSEPTT